MGFKLRKSKAPTPPANDTTTHLTTKTTSPALAHSSQTGTATYASKNGHKPSQQRMVQINRIRRLLLLLLPSSTLSSSGTHTNTSGNAIAGVIKGGTFAYAAPGGHGEAAYCDGSRFGASVAYGREKKGGGIQLRYSDLVAFRKEEGRRGIGGCYAGSGDEGEDSDG